MFPPCCISYYSYIKPQHCVYLRIFQLVVYRTIPTSNHNAELRPLIATKLYIVLFLHQTTTCYKGDVCKTRLYIVLFLHQTTTRKTTPIFTPCCISYYSYIKPQQRSRAVFVKLVVYRTIPTSNHNYVTDIVFTNKVVYRTIPTSNHNTGRIRALDHLVVYRTIPTSNHNRY